MTPGNTRDSDRRRRGCFVRTTTRTTTLFCTCACDFIAARPSAPAQSPPTVSAAHVELENRSKNCITRSGKLSVAYVGRKSSGAAGVARINKCHFERGRVSRYKTSRAGIRVMKHISSLREKLRHFYHRVSPHISVAKRRICFFNNSQKINFPVEYRMRFKAYRDKNMSQTFSY